MAHRVVVIGSGFGGISATRALSRTPVEVTLIDRTSHHLFQPLLYQVATGILSEGEITPPTREVLRKQENVRVVLGTVTHIDLTTRTVVTRQQDTVTRFDYDSLVVAAGATDTYFGREHLAPFAPGLKSIEDAMAHRARIFDAFEMAELTADPAERDPWLTFVVVGAGPTGVEMAGQLIELSRRSLARNYRSFDPATARVILVEAGPQVLPHFGDHLSAATLRSLRHLGVDVRLHTTVEDADEQGAVVQDQTGRHRIEARTLVWAAGVTASPLGGLLAHASGTPQTKGGQLVVSADCSLPGHPEVFVVGDMMQAGVPGVAQVAIQSGKFAAAQIVARLQGRSTERTFRYRDKGSLATIARFRAVADLGRTQLTGLPAWLIWLGVHLLYLVCFRNRFLVLIHWAISFLGRGRAERTSPVAPWTSGASPPAPHVSRARPHTR